MFDQCGERETRDFLFFSRFESKNLEWISSSNQGAEKESLFYFFHFSYVFSYFIFSYRNRSVIGSRGFRGKISFTFVSEYESKILNVSPSSNASEVSRDEKRRQFLFGATENSEPSIIIKEMKESYDQSSIKDYDGIINDGE